MIILSTAGRKCYASVPKIKRRLRVMATTYRYSGDKKYRACCEVCGQLLHDGDLIYWSMYTGPFHQSCASQEEKSV